MCVGGVVSELLVHASHCTDEETEGPRGVSDLASLPSFKCYLTEVGRKTDF